MQQRVGYFVVNRVFLQDILRGDGHNVFHNFIPLDVEHEYISGTVKYIGVHPDFDLIYEGEIVPRYEAIFHDKRIFPTWIRK